MAIEYSPKNAEIAVYEGLWKVASAPSGGADLSGTQAVEFFRKSGVDLGILKQIWTISTPVATMSMQQFYTALRLITMVQNGDIPLSRESMYNSANTNYGPSNNLPKFRDIQLPLQAAASSVAGTAAYAITPEEHIKYFNLFKTYDTDADGYLSGIEARAVFAHSRLEQAVLRAIWEMSDDDKDSQLSSKEFCVAFHLILCISKKGYPLPNTLPPQLKNFLVAAPAIPILPPNPAAAPSQSATPLSTPSVNASHSVSAASVAPAPAGPPSTSPSLTAGSSKAFAPPSIANFSNPSTATPSAVPPPIIQTGLSDNEEIELTSAVSAIRDTSHRALSASDIAAKSNSTNASALKLLLQKLAQDKVALAAAVREAEAEATDSANRLATVIDEVKGLQEQLQDLRAALEAKRRTISANEASIGDSRVEKQKLAAEIAEARAELGRVSNEVTSLAGEVGKSDGQIAELESRAGLAVQEKHAAEGDLRGARAELELLRGVLAALRDDKAVKVQELTRLQLSKQRGQDLFERSHSAAQANERELIAIREEKRAVDDEKSIVLSQIKEEVSALSFSSSFPVPAPDPSPVPSAPTSTPVTSAGTSALITTAANSKVIEIPALTAAQVAPSPVPTTVHTAPVSILHHPGAPSHHEHGRREIHFDDTPIVHSAEIFPASSKTVVDTDFVAAHDDSTVDSSHNGNLTNSEGTELAESLKSPLHESRQSSVDPFDTFGNKPHNASAKSIKEAAASGNSASRSTSSFPAKNVQQGANGFEADPFATVAEVFDDDSAKAKSTKPFETDSKFTFDDAFATDPVEVHSNHVPTHANPGTTLGFDDDAVAAHHEHSTDAFDASFPDDFGKTHKVHFADPSPSRASANVTPVTTTHKSASLTPTAAKDDFGFGGFDSNPFDDPSFSAFGSADGFSAAFPAFDAFGSPAAPPTSSFEAFEASSSSSNKPANNNGFTDAW